MLPLMETALNILKNALTFGINPSLEPMKKICALMGHPEKHYICIQVAGTNGKSSTSRYLAALLQAKGYTTGLYTSPELISLAERVEINGSVIDDESFAQAIISVHKTASASSLELTEFELLTAATLWLFAKHNVEYAVLEVGLGGRWDATSVVYPRIAVFTGVDLDHTAILGNTIAEIAEEKAAIIKEGTFVVAAPTDPEATRIIKARAAEMQAPFFEVPRADIPEPGSYQAQNKLTACTAANVALKQAMLEADTCASSLDSLAQYTAYDEESARAIVDNTLIPGRLEVVHTHPLVIIDAAHNPASAYTLAKSLQTSRECIEIMPGQNMQKLPGHRLDAILLLAVLSDKDAEGIIRALTPHFSCVAVTQTASTRATPAEELARLVQLSVPECAPAAMRDVSCNASCMSDCKATGEKTPHELPLLVFDTTQDALEELLKQERPIVATGSITLAGEVKRILGSSSTLHTLSYAQSSH